MTEKRTAASYYGFDRQAAARRDKPASRKPTRRDREATEDIGVTREDFLRITGIDPDRDDEPEAF